MTTALIAPARRYEVPQPVDLTDPATRRRLSASAVAGMERLADAWGLRTQDLGRLLGDVPDSTWYAWRAKPPADLGVDRLTRVSLLLGIHSALRALHGKRLAATWVTLPNTNPLFGGRTPLDAMVHGGIPVMTQVRALLDGRRGGL